MHGMCMHAGGPPDRPQRHPYNETSCSFAQRDRLLSVDSLAEEMDIFPPTTAGYLSKVTPVRPLGHSRSFKLDTDIESIAHRFRLVLKDSSSRRGRVRMCCRQELSTDKLPTQL